MDGLDLLKGLDLLRKAKKVLDKHWFSDDGGHNHEDVIEMSEEIDEFFGGKV